SSRWRGPSLPSSIRRRPSVHPRSGSSSHPPVVLLRLELLGHPSTHCLVLILPARVLPSLSLMDPWFLWGGTGELVSAVWSLGLLVTVAMSGSSTFPMAS